MRGKKAVEVRDYSQTPIRGSMLDERFKTDRIGACNYLRRRIAMPTSIPFYWLDNGLQVKIKPRGLQKLPLFKYLSGTLPKIIGSFQNDSSNMKNISCNCTLFRLTGTKEPADLIIQVQDSFELKPKSKEDRKWELYHLPQPGNYVLKLDIKSNGDTPQRKSQDVFTFDALPRDMTLLNLQNNLIVGIIMLIMGGLLGKLVF
jgi:hypothetical protein